MTQVLRFQRCLLRQKCPKDRALLLHHPRPAQPLLQRSVRKIVLFFFIILGRRSLCCSSLSFCCSFLGSFLCFLLQSGLTLKEVHVASKVHLVAKLKTLTCKNGEKRLLRCRRLLQLLITEPALSRSSNFACFGVLWQQI